MLIKGLVPPDPDPDGARYAAGFKDGQQSILSAIALVLPGGNLPGTADRLHRCSKCEQYMEIGQAAVPDGHDGYRNIIWAHRECPRKPVNLKRPTAPPNREN